MDQLLSIITIGGAAGALLLVLKYLTDKPPKLHTHSEVEGLQQDKADLLKITKGLTESLRTSNEADQEILRLLKEARHGSTE